MSIFQQGDLVEFDFSPSQGHEPKGRRPGLVVSSDEFNWTTSMTLICPITTTVNDYPLHFRLPEQLDEVYGVVVLEQIRAYDLEARNAKVLAHLDTDSMFMKKVKSVIRSFI